MRFWNSPKSNVKMCFSSREAESLVLSGIFDQRNRKNFPAADLLQCSHGTAEDGDDHNGSGPAVATRRGHFHYGVPDSLQSHAIRVKNGDEIGPSLE